MEKKIEMFLSNFLVTVVIFEQFHRLFIYLLILSRIR